jgi:hypothetical protein
MTITSDKSFEKISKHLTEVLNKVLTEKADKLKVENIMKQWNNKKEDIIKFVNSSTQKLKKKKDPNAPKKWSTAYLLFCNDNRNKVKEANPSIVATEITKELGKMWKTISDEDKKLYEAKSQIEKTKYQQEMDSYSPQEENDSSKKKKRVEGPKKPLTAYMYFCQHERERAKTDSVKLSTSATELGKRWHLLTDDEKVSFNDKAKADKLRYEKEKGGNTTVVKEESKKETVKEEPKKESTKTSKVKEPVKKSEPEPKSKPVKKQEKRKISSSSEESEDDLFEDDD